VELPSTPAEVIRPCGPDTGAKLIHRLDKRSSTGGLTSPNGNARKSPRSPLAAAPYVMTSKDSKVKACNLFWSLHSRH